MKHQWFAYVIDCCLAFSLHKYLILKDGNTFVLSDPPIIPYLWCKKMKAEREFHQ